ncbi:MAG: hypothetical protein RL293_1574 [Bacteroidota bacterium]|jgi:hypothetical protein
MPQTYNLPAHFPQDARLWVFVGDRRMTETEIAWMNESLSLFVSSWQTHGKSLDAVGFVLHDTAIVIVANENAVKASGCSMDKINHFVKDAGGQLSMDFFNRMNVLRPTETGTYALSRFELNASDMIHSAMQEWSEMTEKL